MRRSINIPQTRSWLVSLVVTVVSLFCVCVLWDDSSLLAIALLLLSATLLRSRSDVVSYALIAVLGALAEAIAISFGAWGYGKPDLLGIPYWLAPLWGIVGIFISRLRSVIDAFASEERARRRADK